MKVKVRKNPETTIELGVLIGYRVNSWTKYPDGSMEIDIAADRLTDGEKATLITKLEQAQVHLVES